MDGGRWRMACARIGAMETLPPLYPLRLERKLDHRLWGGSRLAAWFGLPQPWPTDLAESWQVYAENRVLNGPLAGRTLAAIARDYGPTLLGTLSPRHYGHDFPLLAKFIDANDRLSIQVHPDDAYAHTVEAHTGFHGKTEAWYIIAAEPGAGLVYGLRRATTPAEFRQAVAEGCLEELIHIVPVQAGDVIFVPAGTLHAINAGILLFEIQQTSDLTYRVYDYGRRDGQGRLRELHLDKALAVLDFRPAGPAQVPPLPLAPGHDLLVACPYFALERLCGGEYTLAPRPTSFEIHTLIAGRAEIAGETLAPGESLLLPADREACTVQLSADGVLLRCYVPDLADELWPRLQALGYDEARITHTIRTPSPGAYTR